MNCLRKTAALFAALFLIVFVVTNIPAFNDAQGYNFGLFKIDPIDNWVHLATAIIGFLAVWRSTRASMWFLLGFGILYALDAATGMLTQLGLLDASLIQEIAAQKNVWNPDLSILNWLINAPHIAISAIMILCATLWAHRLERANTFRSILSIRLR